MVSISVWMEWPSIKTGQFWYWAKLVDAVTSTVILKMTALWNAVGKEALSFIFLLDNDKEKETCCLFKLTTHMFSIWIRQLCTVCFWNQGSINLTPFMQWSKNKYSICSQKLRQAFPALSCDSHIQYGKNTTSHYFVQIKKIEEEKES